MVIWLIGLAGAGKTAIGREVYKRLRAQRANVVLIDGDDVRAMMGHDLGYTMEDRERNAWRICRLCEFLDRQGIDVVCAILSLFHHTQAWNREHMSRYFEVFIDVPMDVLRARDQKGLYSAAEKDKDNQVAGVGLPFSPPPNADLVICNDGTVPIEAQAERILDALQSTAR